MNWFACLPYILFFPGTLLADTKNPIITVEARWGTPHNGSTDHGVSWAQICPCWPDIAYPPVPGYHRAWRDRAQGLATNSIFCIFLYLVLQKKSFMCLEGKSMFPQRGTLFSLSLLAATPLCQSRTLEGLFELTCCPSGALNLASYVASETLELQEQT